MSDLLVVAADFLWGALLGLAWMRIVAWAVEWKLRRIERRAEESNLTSDDRASTAATPHPSRR